MRNLVSCVDCGNPLSPRAKECPKCNSQDPFGSERSKEQFQMAMLIVTALIALIMGGLWHFDIIDPVALIKGFSR